MVPVAVTSLKMICSQPLGIANYAHIHAGWLRGRQLLGLVECAMRSDIEQSYDTPRQPICRKHSKPLGKSCARGISNETQTPRTTLGSRLVVNFSN